MAIELARARAVRKPWGSTDLRPWSRVEGDGGAIGELWFQRTVSGMPDPALLLKLLFTAEPLSIQVHPDDAYARSIGLPHGKAEAWYILAALPGAKVAVGLTRRLATAELHAAIEDGSIADLVQWREVRAGDAIFVPAGTIHAIGAGLVLAEIQQRSDATFRLFDHGRQRELHVDHAVAAANAGPAAAPSAPSRLGDGRTLLVASPHFVLERIDLRPGSGVGFHAEHETWLLVIGGEARIGSVDAATGDAVFLEADRTAIEVGFAGVQALVAYPGPDPRPGLLRRLEGRNERPAPQLPLYQHRAIAGSPVRSTEVPA